MRIDHVITMSLELPSAAYPSPGSAARFYEAVVQRLQSVPGIEQASVAQGLPLEGVQWGEYMTYPGAKDLLVVRLKLVDPRYFGTLGIPVESGRGIEDRDRAGAPPVVVINQEVARFLSGRLGVANPVGQTVSIDVPGYGPIPESAEKLQVVGVIRNERTAGLNAPPELVAYLPIAYAPRQDIKSGGPHRNELAAAIARHREAAKRQVYPHLPPGDAEVTMEQVKGRYSLRQARRSPRGYVRCVCGFRRLDGGRAKGFTPGFWHMRSLC